MKPNWMTLTPVVLLSRWNQATGPPSAPLCLPQQPMRLRRRSHSQTTTGAPQLIRILSKSPTVATLPVPKSQMK